MAERTDYQRFRAEIRLAQSLQRNKAAYFPSIERRGSLSGILMTVVTSPPASPEHVDPQGPEAVDAEVLDVAAREDGEEISSEPADKAWHFDLKEILLTALVLFASFYTIYFTRAVLFPIILAVLLNLVFKPVVLRLQRLRIPTAVSATLILVGLALTVIVGTSLLWDPATARIREITSPGYLDNVIENLKPLQKPLQELEKASEKVNEMTNGNGQSEPVKVQIEQPQFGNMLTVTGGFVSTLVIMFVLLFFLLAAGDRFMEKLVELMPTFKDKRRVVDLSRQVRQSMSDYLFTITAINIGLGVAIGAGMWLIDLPNPILWGVIATLLNYIPFAGAAVGAILVFFEGLTSFDSLGHAALAPTIYVALNALEANFVTPALLGKSISLNPVMIVLAIVFWGWLWGVGGVLLSVPLLVVLKIFFDHSQSLKPLGVFMER